MKKKMYGPKFIQTIALLGVAVTLTSCLQSATSNVRGRSALSSTSAVAVTQGRILKDNPIILSGNASLAIGTDLSKYLSTAVITSNTFLRSNPACEGLTYCFEVRNNTDSTSALQTSDGKWGYTADSDEFLQVNTFYHMNSIITQFFTNLGLSFTYAYGSGSTPVYDTAIPLDMRNTLTGTYTLNSQILTAFSNCDAADNSYYDQSKETLCFGYSGASKALHWADDSTVIYHETGHFLQRLQLNYRNTASVVKTQMGSSINVYNEAGALGEGLSDFYSYYANGRSHWGEWAAGKLNSSRPMSESDAIHAPGISTDDDQRLSYPQYLTYDPNYPTEPVEDIHVSGMIISHYLVALTSDIESKCAMTNKNAREYVVYLLGETMAELGDLTAKGTYNGSVGKINMDATNSSLWFNTNNPINYRSFTQTLAKNLLITLGNATLSRCNGSYYSKDYIEAMLDNYGLLLFKKYPQYRNLTSSSNVNASVTATNRKKTVLIAKSNLILDPTTGASSAYVIDNRAQIYAGVSKYLGTGQIAALSELTPTDLSYNNGNSKVSPGEVVAIALNLYNNSNSTMAGVEVLANDWDHAETKSGSTYGKACRFSTSLSSDGWPLDSEGAASLSTNTASTCDSIGVTTADFAPVCFIQSTTGSATTWISQKEFKDKISLDDNSCLDKSNTKFNDCFIRAVKGFDRAYYSKINAKSTWGTTMANPTTGAAYGLDWGNVILFEVNKNIPPGTTVSCRLRARFTNCEDCFMDANRDNNDYLDTEYNGPRPYKIIQLQIPIVD
jgi:hypothetical protein